MRFRSFVIPPRPSEAASGKTSRSDARRVATVEAKLSAYHTGPAL